MTGEVRKVQQQSSTCSFLCVHAWFMHAYTYACLHAHMYVQMMMDLTYQFASPDSVNILK